MSGSIAVYKAVELLRRLRDMGADVRVVMTQNAARFVSRLTFETLSGRPVSIDQFGEGELTSIEHIDVTRDLDLALVAPATANIIGKMASGIADDMLSTTLTALDCPIVVAPAMNDRMFRNPILQRNIALLRDNGVRFIEPGTGALACGTTGPGRLADVEIILQEVSGILTAPVMKGMNVLVTAVPTREPIDAVRYISNPSTGKMGYALAAAARDRGARVILISGPCQLAPAPGITVISVNTASEMRDAVMDHVKQVEVVIMAAAVSDFKPAVASDRKIKKDKAAEVITLERTEDILAALGKLPDKPFLVGFAAETDDVIENAFMKLKNKNLDMVVANDLARQGAGFGSDTNAVTIIDRSGNRAEIPIMPKTEIARIVLDKVLEIRGK